ncbi:MAG TPA: prolipoprotein diacylglyceryl transferase [Methylomirabilota bacterium]|nr:prolipoprotein diacylglyceryl transferase [Methylomirabilota bacterium]
MKKIYWTIGVVGFIILTYFIFIPSFKGWIVINPLIQVGSLMLRWYGLIFAASIVAAYLVIRKNSWKFGISISDIDDYTFWTVIIGVIGARIYYVLFSWDYYSQNLSEIYKIWHGGLSIYGGVLAGIIFTYFFTRKRVYSFWTLADLVVLGLPLGQAIGRFGNFFNQEAFGIPTNLPWKMFVAPQYRPAGLSNYNYFHPAFLYEALADLIVFFILQKMVGKVKTGTLVLTYLFTYSIFRFFIEGIRIDSFFIHGIRVDQVIAVIIVIGSGIGLFFTQKNSAATD